MCKVLATDHLGNNKVMKANCETQALLVADNCTRVKKLLILYVTQKFITVFARTCHQNLHPCLLFLQDSFQYSLPVCTQLTWSLCILCIPSASSHLEKKIKINDDFFSLDDCLNKYSLYVCRGITHCLSCSLAYEKYCLM